MNNRRILLVDDVGSMRSVIKSFLHDGKHELVDEACDGAHALEMLGRRKYAVVICDLEMPKLNGIELLKKIREEKRMRHVQFIMITTHNEAEKIKEAIAAGVDDYIAKPFQAISLLTKVEKAFEKRTLGITQESLARVNRAAEQSKCDVEQAKSDTVEILNEVIIETDD